MSQYNGQIVILKQPGCQETPIKWFSSVLVIGSDESCDGCIHSEVIAPRHALLELDSLQRAVLSHVAPASPPGLYRTLVAAREIAAPTVLEHNAVFTVGRINFRFEYPLRSRWRREQGTTAVISMSSPKTDRMRHASPKVLFASTPKNNTYTVLCHKTNSPTVSPINTSRTKICTVQSKKRLNVRPFLTPIQNKLISKSGRKSKMSALKNDDLQRHVSFGPNLSPEQFDKELPPIQPLKKGATPMKGQLDLIKAQSCELVNNGRYKTRQSGKRNFSVISQDSTTKSISKLAEQSFSPLENSFSSLPRQMSKNPRLSIDLEKSPVKYGNSETEQKQNEDLYDYSVENENFITGDLLESNTERNTSQHDESTKSRKSGLEMSGFYDSRNMDNIKQMETQQLNKISRIIESPKNKKTTRRKMSNSNTSRVSTNETYFADQLNSSHSMRMSKLFQTPQTESEHDDSKTNETSKLFESNDTESNESTPRNSGNVSKSGLLIEDTSKSVEFNREKRSRKSLTLSSSNQNEFENSTYSRKSLSEPRNSINVSQNFDEGTPKSVKSKRGRPSKKSMILNSTNLSLNATENEEGEISLINSLKSLNESRKLVSGENSINKSKNNEIDDEETKEVLIEETPILVKSKRGRPSKKSMNLSSRSLSVNASEKEDGELTVADVSINKSGNASEIIDDNNNEVFEKRTSINMSINTESFHDGTPVSVKSKRGRPSRKSMFLNSSKDGEFSLINNRKSLSLPEKNDVFVEENEKSVTGRKSMNRSINNETDEEKNKVLTEETPTSVKPKRGRPSKKSMVLNATSSLNVSDEEEAEITVNDASINVSRKSGNASEIIDDNNSEEIFEKRKSINTSINMESFDEETPKSQKSKRGRPSRKSMILNSSNLSLNVSEKEEEISFINNNSRKSLSESRKSEKIGVSADENEKSVSGRKSINRSMNNEADDEDKIELIIEETSTPVKPKRGRPSKKSMVLNARTSSLNVSDEEEAEITVNDASINVSRKSGNASEIIDDNNNEVFEKRKSRNTSMESFDEETPKSVKSKRGRPSRKSMILNSSNLSLNDNEKEEDEISFINSRKTLSESRKSENIVSADENEKSMNRNLNMTDDDETPILVKSKRGRPSKKSMNLKSRRSSLNVSEKEEGEISVNDVSINVSRNANEIIEDELSMNLSINNDETPKSIKKRGRPSRKSMILNSSNLSLNVIEKEDGEISLIDKSRNISENIDGSIKNNETPKSNQSKRGRVSTSASLYESRKSSESEEGVIATVLPRKSLMTSKISENIDLSADDESEEIMVSNRNSMRKSIGNRKSTYSKTVKKDPNGEAIITETPAKRKRGRPSKKSMVLNSSNLLKNNENEDLIDDISLPRRSTFLDESLNLSNLFDGKKSIVSRTSGLITNTKELPVKENEDPSIVVGNNTVNVSTISVSMSQSMNEEERLFINQTPNSRKSRISNMTMMTNNSNFSEDNDNMDTKSANASVRKSTGSTRHVPPRKSKSFIRNLSDTNNDDETDDERISQFRKSSSFRKSTQIIDDKNSSSLDRSGDMISQKTRNSNVSRGLLTVSSNNNQSATDDSEDMLQSSVNLFKSPDFNNISATTPKKSTSKSPKPRKSMISSKSTDLFDSNDTEPSMEETFKSRKSINHTDSRKSRGRKSSKSLAMSDNDETNTSNDKVLITDTPSVLQAALVSRKSLTPRRSLTVSRNISDSSEIEEIFDEVLPRKSLTNDDEEMVEQEIKDKRKSLGRKSISKSINNESFEVTPKSIRRRQSIKSLIFESGKENDDTEISLLDTSKNISKSLNEDENDEIIFDQRRSVDGRKSFISGQLINKSVNNEEVDEDRMEVLLNETPTSVKSKRGRPSKKSMNLNSRRSSLNVSDREEGEISVNDVSIKVSRKSRNESEIIDDNNNEVFEKSINMSINNEETPKSIKSQRGRPSRKSMILNSSNVSEKEDGEISYINNRKSLSESRRSDNIYVSANENEHSVSGRKSINKSINMTDNQETSTPVKPKRGRPSKKSMVLNARTSSLNVSDEEEGEIIVNDASINVSRKSGNASEIIDDNINEEIFEKRKSINTSINMESFDEETPKSVKSKRGRPSRKSMILNSSNLSLNVSEKEEDEISFINNRKSLSESRKSEKIGVSADENEKSVSGRKSINRSMNNEAEDEDEIELIIEETSTPVKPKRGRPSKKSMVLNSRNASEIIDDNNNEVFEKRKSINASINNESFGEETPKSQKSKVGRLSMNRSINNKTDDEENREVLIEEITTSVKSKRGRPSKKSINSRTSSLNISDKEETVDIIPEVISDKRKSFISRKSSINNARDDEENREVEPIRGIVSYDLSNDDSEEVQNQDKITDTIDYNANRKPRKSIFIINENNNGEIEIMKEISSTKSPRKRELRLDVTKMDIGNNDNSKSTRQRKGKRVNNDREEEDEDVVKPKRLLRNNLPENKILDDDKPVAKRGRKKKCEEKMIEPEIIQESESKESIGTRKGKQEKVNEQEMEKESEIKKPVSRKRKQINEIINEANNKLPRIDIDQQSINSETSRTRSNKKTETITKASNRKNKKIIEEPVDVEEESEISVPISRLVRGKKNDNVKENLVEEEKVIEKESEKKTQTRGRKKKINEVSDSQVSITNDTNESEVKVDQKTSVIEDVIVEEEEPVKKTQTRGRKKKVEEIKLDSEPSVTSSRAGRSRAENLNKNIIKIDLVEEVIVEEEEPVKKTRGRKKKVEEQVKVGSESSAISSSVGRSRADNQNSKTGLVEEVIVIEEEEEPEKKTQRRGRKKKVEEVSDSVTREVKVDSESSAISARTDRSRAENSNKNNKKIDLVEEVIVEEEQPVKKTQTRGRKKKIIETVIPEEEEQEPEHDREPITRGRRRNAPKVRNSAAASDVVSSSSNVPTRSSRLRSKNQPTDNQSVTTENTYSEIIDRESGKENENGEKISKPTTTRKRGRGKQDEETDELESTVAVKSSRRNALKEIASTNIATSQPSLAQNRPRRGK